MLGLSLKLLLLGFLGVALLEETSGQASSRYQSCALICKDRMPRPGGSRGSGFTDSDWVGGERSNLEGRDDLEGNMMSDSGADTGSQGGLQGRIFNSIKTGKKNSTTTQTVQAAEGVYDVGGGKKVTVVQRSNSVQSSRYETQRIRWLGKRRRREAETEKEGEEEPLP
ncbi:unnamed protein product [Orchesella dallaii]|uniref:Uncharacterized protein n=1 Tax=Orchesella dallaii TaxID=48710 RepID=A0ABP1RVU3_9HEXA